MLILDKFFLKYERGVELTPLPSPEKTTLKKPSLIRVKQTNACKSITSARLME